MRQGELDVYLFHQGTNFRAYEYLGVNLKKRGDIFCIPSAPGRPMPIEYRSYPPFADGTNRFRFQE